MKIAHISDLHFSKVCTKLSQFHSKQWIGNLNLVLSRRKGFVPDKPYALIDKLKRLNIEDVVIAGDLSTTGYDEEFKLAKKYIDALHAAGIRTFIVPGNHDHYTRGNYKRRLFYDYFRPVYDKCPLNLKDNGVTFTAIGSNWHLVALDTALATSWHLSTGLFSKKVEENLLRALTYIPKSDNILLVNHFPFTKHEHPWRHLKQAKVLKELLKEHPQIKLYLHGHTHKSSIADLRQRGLPVSVGSGSIAESGKETWNLLSLEESSCQVDVYKWDQELTWEVVKSKTFTWESEV